MHRNKASIIAGAIIFLAIVGGVFSWRAYFGPDATEAAPPISWTPKSLEASLFVGESKTINVSFTASEGLSDVVVRATPEIEPFVKAEPSELGVVEKGETKTLSITFSAPTDAPAAIHDGTIQLRSKSKPGRTFSRPLPITFEIVRGVFRSEELGIEQLIVPDKFAVVGQSDVKAVLEDSGIDGYTIEVSRRPNPALLSIESWLINEFFRQPGTPLNELTTPPEPITIAGRASLRLDAEDESSFGFLFFNPSGDGQNVYVFVFYRPRQQETQNFAIQKESEILQIMNSFTPIE